MPLEVNSNIDTQALTVNGNGARTATIYNSKADCPKYLKVMQYPNITITGAASIYTTYVNNGGTLSEVDFINQLLNNPNVLTEYVSATENLIADAPLVISTGLTSINDMSVYDNSGSEISDAIVSIVTGGTITLESNNTISNIIIKAIGKI